MTTPPQTDLFADPEVEAVPEDVRRLFERLALRVYRAGITHSSADFILHRIRWEMTIERRDTEFKVNNNWSAVLSRWLMDRRPELKRAKFFETRVRKSKQ